MRFTLLLAAAVILVRDPTAAIERVTVSFGTAIQPKLVAQRFKPRLQWIARPYEWDIKDNN
jgi:hypothetical protein